MDKIRRTKATPWHRKGRLERIWFPDRFPREMKEGIHNCLYNYFVETQAKALGLSMSGYYTILENAFEDRGAKQEAWVCRMIQQNKFNQLFNKEPTNLDSTEERDNFTHVYDCIDRILELQEAFNSFQKLLRPRKKLPQHKSALSPAEIELARTRYRKLTGERGLSDNRAYEQIARELTKASRKVSKTTIRRVCDGRFAGFSGCTYDSKTQPKIAFLSVP